MHIFRFGSVSPAEKIHMRALYIVFLAAYGRVYSGHVILQDFFNGTKFFLLFSCEKHLMA